MTDPRSFITHIVLKTSYGIEPKGKDDPFIARAVQVAIGFAAAASPGAFLVDFIPVLKYVPEWMPGAAWKRFARHHRTVSTESREIPFNEILELHVSTPARLLNRNTLLMSSIEAWERSTLRVEGLDRQASP